MSHKVFIEGCRDHRPETATALARAIASRYGIDPAEIEARLKLGRFQVKANLNLASARMFVEYLEDAGALCSVVDAAGQTVLRSAAVQPAAPQERDPEGRLEVSMPSLAEADAFALLTPPPPPDAGNEYESGLSAAGGAAGAGQALGVLDDASAASSGFQLSAVDGSRDDTTSARGGRPVTAPDDVAAFLPPDMLEEKALELDIDEPAPRTPPVADAPALDSSPRVESAPPEPALAAQPRQAPSPVAGSSRLLGRLSRDERLRFAIGVAAAVLLGFMAVHFFAAGRETDRYGAVISELEVQYAQVTSAEAHRGLQEARRHALSSLEERRSTIVIMSSVLWLIVGGVLLLVWLRLIDWTRWREHGVSAART